MTASIVNIVDETIETFEPRSKYDIHKIGPRPDRYVSHKLLDY